MKMWSLILPWQSPSKEWNIKNQVKIWSDRVLYTMYQLIPALHLMYIEINLYICNIYNMFNTEIIVLRLVQWHFSHIWYKVVKLQCLFAQKSLQRWSQLKLYEVWRASQKSCLNPPKCHVAPTRRTKIKEKEEKRESQFWYDTKVIYYTSCGAQSPEDVQLACRDEAFLGGWCTLHSLPTPPPLIHDGTSLMVSQIDSSSPDGSVW